MVPWFQGYRDIFTGRCPWGEATKLSSLLHCLLPSHMHPHTWVNYNQSLHMIGRISQSRKGGTRGGGEKQREKWSDQNPTSDKSEESEMPCRLFPSQSPHYHVQLDGGTAHLIPLHCFPPFFIFL